MSQLAINHHPNRARIVRLALLALVLTTLLAVSSVALAQFIWPTGPGALREISVSNLSNEPLATQFLIADGIPIWLVRQPDGNLSAFWARSPHRGCNVEYDTATSGRLGGVVNSLLANSSQPGVFYDVCSGAAWLLDGTRIFGPAPRGLDQFEVQLTGPSEATINLRRTLVGACSSGITFRAPPPHYCSTPEQPLYDSNSLRPS
ncbi:MAG: hypothetical protein HOH95_08320 [Dehalococcoidia bacterium]|jgi:Rieske Fe-S protein|nr:hypothetical protein [Dehalococcoidia bacterium]